MDLFETLPTKLETLTGTADNKILKEEILNQKNMNMNLVA